MTTILLTDPPRPYDITAEQVCDYLYAHKWTAYRDGADLSFERGPCRILVPLDGGPADRCRRLTICITGIAAAEGRRPTAVAADILGPVVGVGGMGCGGDLDKPAKLERGRCMVRAMTVRHRVELARQQAERAHWYVEQSEEESEQQ